LGGIRDDWKPVIELHREVYEAGLATMKPGASFGAVADVVSALGAKRGMKTVMQLHGCGYGDDGPLLPARSRGNRVSDVAIAKGNAFVWKPIAMTADEKIQFTWGGPILVTDKGCETLFKRSHGMVAIS
jgi:methionine aminopeptidase